MQVWNVLHAARWKYKTQKSPKIAICSPSHNFVRLYIFATKAYIDDRKKTAKHQYLLHMSSQYVELQPTNGWDRFRSLGHPSKFQRVSRLGFVTAPTSLNGGQPSPARCLAVSWSGTLSLCIHYLRLLPPITAFCQLQNSLCVQVLRSPTLAALLRGIRAVSVSQTLRHGTMECNYRSFAPRHIQQRPPPIFRTAVITLGIGPHFSFKNNFPFCFMSIFNYLHVFYTLSLFSYLAY